MAPKTLDSKITLKSPCVTFTLTGRASSGRLAIRGMTPVKFQGSQKKGGKSITVIVADKAPKNSVLLISDKTYTLEKHKRYNYYVGYCNGIFTKVSIGTLTAKVTYWPTRK